MSTAMMERERNHEYLNRIEVEDVLNDNDMWLEDCDYIAAIQIPVGVTEIQGVATAMSLPTKSLRTYYIEDGPTGYFQPQGGERLLFINQYDAIDYDLVSEMHTVPDADAYVSMTNPWDEGIEYQFDLIKEWYREDSYPGHFEADEKEKGGTRG